MLKPVMGSRGKALRAWSGLWAMGLLAWGCAPAALQQALPSLVVDEVPAPNPVVARERLSGSHGRDFSLSLVGAAERFGAASALAPKSAQRQLQAFGDPPHATWSQGGKPGVPLANLGCANGDVATNGAAALANGGRVMVLTRDGKLLDINADNPHSGRITTDLDSSSPGTFSKTYVSLSFDGRYAFALSDEGRAYAVDLSVTTSGSHPVRSVDLGRGACKGSALFIDPLVSGGSNNTMYAVSNSGWAVRVRFVGGGSLASATFNATSLAKVTPITTALSGSELVMAPPVVLGGVLAVGDRRGNVNLWSAAAGLKSWSVNAVWPIETAVAVDVDDNLNITDLFATAGPKLGWVTPATNAVRLGMNALVDIDTTNNNRSGTITPSNVMTYIRGGSTTTFNTRYNERDAVSVYARSTASFLPEAFPGPVDIFNFSYGNKVTGQPPTISTYAGSGGTSGGVPDFTALNASAFNQAWQMEVEGEGFSGDDGSMYIANRNAGQVLYRPSSASSSAKWTTTYANTILDSTRLYEIIGDADGGPTVVGNRGTSTNFRRTTLFNQVRDVAVGNLGLYVANADSAWDKNAVLFLPKVGVTSAFGYAVSAERVYVLTRSCDPMAIAIDRRTAGRDTLYIASGPQAPANTNRLLKMESNSNADVQLVSTSMINGPNDMCIDDFGNLFITNPGGTRVIQWFVGGAGNTRSWGVVGAKVANTMYTIVSNNPTPNFKSWYVAFSKRDPQSPGGALYLSNTSDNFPNTLYRLDGTGNLAHIAGRLNDTKTANQGSGYAGDGGPAVAALLNAPRGMAVDAEGSVYVCDGGNNRIRKLSHPTFTGGDARGYINFAVAAGYNATKPIYNATLKLWTRLGGTMPPPRVGVASPFLGDGGTTPWSADNLNSTNAPEINLTGGLGSPVTPAVNGAGNWVLAANQEVNISFPPGAFPTGNAGGGNLSVGVVSPADANDYYYPESQGVPASANRAFSFHTPRSGGTSPQLVVSQGETRLLRPIMSPPAISGLGANRKVFLVNGNALFRYAANPSNPNAFGTSMDFTVGRIRRVYAEGARTTNPEHVCFQPNATPPFVDLNGRVHTLDVYYNADNGGGTWYALNAFNGNAAGPDMSIAGGTFKDITPMNNGGKEAGAPNDNLGIYMSSSVNLNEVYFGLANGRLYRLMLQ